MNPGAAEVYEECETISRLRYTQIMINFTSGSASGSHQINEAVQKTHGIIILVT